MTRDDAQTALYEECLRFIHSVFDITKSTNFYPRDPGDQTVLRVTTERWRGLQDAINECRKEGV